MICSHLHIRQSVYSIEIFLILFIDNYEVSTSLTSIVTHFCDIKTFAKYQLINIGNLGTVNIDTEHNILSG